ncbi:MAG: DUF692 domain-containing protein [Gallionella sp.]
MFNSPPLQHNSALTTSSISGVGVGLRPPHYSEFINSRPNVAWLEVHSENYFGEGPGVTLLEKIRVNYPISLHGVGLSLGSADVLDTHHLKQLQQLIARISPSLVSEHLCWGALGGHHLNDLIPMPYRKEALNLICERVDEVQEFLGRRILIENVSSYLRWQNEELSEWDFVAALAKRTGCGLLLDVNNIYVSAINHGFDARLYLAAMPAESVMEIHLAGHESQNGSLIDTHSRPVCAEVWQLYRDAIQLFGAKPTLIEWDSDIPPLEALLTEALKARDILEHEHAQFA